MTAFCHDSHITTINLGFSESSELEDILLEFSRSTANPWRAQAALKLAAQMKTAMARSGDV